MADEQLTFFEVTGWEFRKGPDGGVLLVFEVPVVNAQGERKTLSLPPLWLDRNRAEELVTSLSKSLSALSAASDDRSLN